MKIGVLKLLTVSANAKINLTLDILGKREDGYHDVELVLQSIALADMLEFAKIDSGIKFNPIETFKIKNGLGLRLTKSIVDHIAYEHDGNKNILTLRKAIK